MVNAGTVAVKSRADFFTDLACQIMATNQEKLQAALAVQAKLQAELDYYESEVGPDTLADEISQIEAELSLSRDNLAELKADRESILGLVSGNKAANAVAECLRHQILKLKSGIDRLEWQRDLAIRKGWYEYSQAMSEQVLRELDEATALVMACRHGCFSEEDILEAAEALEGGTTLISPEKVAVAA